MKAKDYPLTKPICELVSRTLADAEQEVIGEVEVAMEGKKPRKKKEVIGEGVPTEEAPAEEILVEEPPAGEIPVEEIPVEEIGQPRTAIDLKCMEKLKEAKRWCEEHEIIGG